MLTMCMLAHHMTTHDLPRMGRISGSRLEGKQAIISGAARGLGASIARLYALEGATVLLTDILDELGEQTAAAIRDEGGQAIYQHLDVTSESDWTAAVERCAAEFGPVNLFVSNAFRFGGPALADTTTDEWRKGLEVNLTGPFFGMRAVLPTMRANRDGIIVAIASSDGPDASLPTHADYQAAKAGTTALVRHIAVTYGREGIRANAVHPGPIRTPVLIVQGFVPVVEKVAAGVPLGRIAEPEEVAWVAVFLGSDESSYVTGARYLVEGGSTVTIAPVGTAD
ncbi:MAG: putative short-chain dehydrogenase [Conexibacter sp.]|nr:putative short-chain dehydrogenase [Conexibacter sp.]